MPDQSKNWPPFLQIVVLGNGTSTLIGVVKAPIAKAVLILLLGIFMLDIMSAFIKTLSVRYNVLELSAYRNVIGMVPSLLWMLYTKELTLKVRSLIIRQWPLALSRGLMVMMAQLCYYIALGGTEFVIVAALGYTYSLFVVAFSVPILKEKVGVFRSVAVLLGFVGALWILRPNVESFTLFALLPLGAAGFYALSTVTVRLIDTSVSSALVYLYSSLSAAVVSIMIVLFMGGFAGIQTLQDAISITAMSLFGGVGVLLLLLSVRLVAPSVIAPFNYFGLFSAFTIGWLVFGETPFGRLFPGVLLIVAAGLLVFWRESSQARKVSLKTLHK